MPNKPEIKGRTQVKDLPKKEKKLTGKQMKDVKGGSKGPKSLSKDGLPIATLNSL